MNAVQKMEVVKTPALTLLVVFTAAAKIVYF